MLASAEFKGVRGEELARPTSQQQLNWQILWLEKGTALQNRTPDSGKNCELCLEKGLKAEDIDAQFLDEISQEITGQPLKLDEDIVKRALDPVEIVKSRQVPGGPAPSMVKEAISNLEKFINENK
jgi:argininosuccinate lyase